MKKYFDLPIIISQYFNSLFHQKYFTKSLIREKAFFILLFFVFYFVPILSNAQTPDITNGANCDFEWGDPIGIDGCDDESSATADMGQMFGFVDGNDIYVGWERCALGAGTATYGWMFDADCDGSGDALVFVEWAAQGSLCVNEELTLMIDVGCNAGDIDNAAPVYVGTPECGNCDEAGKFMEFKFNVLDVIDALTICGQWDECDCNCGQLELIFAGTLAGGSTNSSMKDEFDVFDFSYTYPTSNSDFICPSDVSLSFDADIDDPTIVGSLIITSGDCGDAIYNGYSDEVFNDGTCTGNYILRTHSVTERCGNEVTCVQRLTFVDNQSPTILCPADLELEVGDPNIENLISQWLSSVTANDNSNIESISNTYDPSNYTIGICGGAMQQIVTFTATDDCQNMSQCMATINIGDMTPPIINCPQNLILDCVNPNNQTLIAEWLDSVMAMDNSTNLVITNSYDPNMFSFTCAGSSFQDVMFIATDDCMIMSNCVATISISDTQGPLITCPIDVTIGCQDDPYDYSLVGSPDVSDICQSELNDPVMYDDVVISTNCLNSEVIERTWNIIDDCNNASSCTQLITILDSEAPQIICPDELNLLVSNPNIEADIQAWLEQVVSFDNCSTSAVTNDYTSSGFTIFCGISGYQDVTFTALDDCGNSSDCIARVTLIDTAPTITCPSDLTLECGSSDNTNLIDDWLASVEASDDSSIEIETSYSVNNGITICGNSEMQEVTFTVTDDCQSTISCQATISILDTSAPEINCPSDISLLSTNPNLEAEVLTWIAEATSTDACGVTTHSHDFTLGGFTSTCGTAGYQDVTIVSTDECGNSSDCTARVTLIDAAPTITCPSDLTLECGSSDNASLIDDWLASVEASDDSSIEIETSYSVNNGITICGNSEMQEVTFTVTDDCQSTVSCQATISILDTSAPEINCPSDISLLSTNPNLEAEVLTWIAEATSTDACGVTTHSHDFTLGGFTSICGTAGYQDVTIVSTDECGNSSDCTARVTLIDPQPTITCPSELVLECGDSENDVLIAEWLESIEANDNSTIDITNDFNLNNLISNCGNTFIQQVEFIVTDGCQSSASCTSTLEIVDTTPPVFDSPPRDYAADCKENVQELFDDWLLTFGYAGYSDNCSTNDNIQVTTNPLSPVFEENSVSTVEFIFTDECGNSTSSIASFSIICIDVVKNVSSVNEAQSCVPGNYDVTFNIRMQNTGNIDVTNLQLNDDIASVSNLDELFVALLSPPSIVSSTASVNPNLNPNYTGTDQDSYIFDWTSGVLLPDQFVEVSMTVEVNPNNVTTERFLYTNQAQGSAISIDFTTSVEDLSDSGLDPESSNPEDIGDMGTSDDPTPLILPAISVTKTLTGYGRPQDPNNNNIYVYFEIGVKNIGNITLGNLDLIEELALPNSFGNYFVGLVPGTSPIIIESTATQLPTLNSSFSGTGANTNMLDGTSGILETNQLFKIELKVELNSIPTTLYNQVIGEGDALGSSDEVILNEDSMPFTAADASDSGLIFEDFNVDNIGHINKEDDPTPVPPVSSLGNLVWKDLNGNGVQDIGEPGVPGVMVEIKRCDGEPLDPWVSQTLVTDANGYYLFDFLLPSDINGTYTLEFTQDDLDCDFTYQNVGSNDGLDNDANRDGLVECYFLQENEDYLDLDVGLLILPKVGNFVWADCNGNGLQDSDEEGIEGVLLEVYDEDGILVNSTASDVDGFYVFDRLYPGDYFIKAIAPYRYDFFAFDYDSLMGSLDSDITNGNGVGTTDYISLTPGECDFDSGDVGLFECSTIGGTVFYDSNLSDVFDDTENGINGVKVEIYRSNNGQHSLYDFIYTGSNPNTESDDGYWKLCLPPGDYFIKYLTHGLTSSTANIGNDENLDSDITNYFGINTTDGFQLGCGDELCDITAGFQPPASIGSRVWFDQNANGIQDAVEVGVADVLVRAYNQQGIVAQETITNSNGDFYIDSLFQTYYYLEVLPPAPSYTLTTPHMSNESIDSDFDHSNGLNTTGLLELKQGKHMQNVDAGLIQSSILSIDWLRIVGEKASEMNVVKWIVSQDESVTGYDIERKYESEDFEVIGRQLSKQCDFETTYTFEDFDNDRMGSYYYRVVMNKENGTSNYSDVVAINVKCRLEVESSSRLYPNPAVNSITLEVSVGQSNSDVLISISNEAGQRVLSNKMLMESADEGKYRYQVDVSSYVRGVYTVEVQVGTEREIKKLILIE